MRPLSALAAGLTVLSAAPFTSFVSSAHPSDGATAHRVLSAPLGRGRLTVSTNGRWAGYYEYRGGITSTSASWRVPTLRCQGTTLSSTWVGVGGLDGSVLLQAGLFDNCLNGTAANGGFVEAYPGNTQSLGLLLRAGDRVTVWVGRVGARWQGRVTDNTTRQSQVVGVNGYKGGGSAEWMTEAYGEPTYQISNFATERFVDLRVDGRPARPTHAWAMRGAAGSVTPTSGYRLVYGPST